jgi:hypothetical protein
MGEFMGVTSQKVRRFVEHPITRLAVGLILFLSGFAEAYRSFGADLSQLQIGAHHGVMLLGLFNMIASIPDIIEGVGSGAQYLEHLEKRGS